jgi:nitrile hydratase accessory protein
VPDARRGVALEFDGLAAPPRKNGELVFDAVWEGRLFGLTMALHDAGRFEWEEFRARLIAEIAQWESSRRGADTKGRYYERWLAAFERLLAEKGLCPTPEIDARARELAARPHGHDHPSADLGLRIAD